MRLSEMALKTLTSYAMRLKMSSQLPDDDDEAVEALLGSLRMDYARLQIGDGTRVLLEDIFKHREIPLRVVREVRASRA